MNGRDFEEIMNLVGLEPSTRMYEAMQMVVLRTMSEAFGKEEAERNAVTVDQAKAEQFIEIFNTVAEKINSIAVSKGFYKHGRNDGQQIALMHSELSEALEYMRHGNPKSEKIPEYTGVEEELADCIIRIMDYAYNMKYRVGEAMIEKMKYNIQRPTMHGGKKF